MNRITQVFSTEQDIFAKASMTFSIAKRNFVDSHRNKYSWSDGELIWSNNTCNTFNQYQQSDILFYHAHYHRVSSTYAMIVTCLATALDNDDIIALSIGSSVNCSMIWISVGCYKNDENYHETFPMKFQHGLITLLKLIYKERKALHG